MTYYKGDVADTPSSQRSVESTAVAGRSVSSCLALAARRQHVDRVLQAMSGAQHLSRSHLSGASSMGVKQVSIKSDAASMHSRKSNAFNLDSFRTPYNKKLQQAIPEPREANDSKVFKGFHCCDQILCI